MMVRLTLLECGSVWLERSAWDGEVVGSSPVIPTQYGVGGEIGRRSGLWLRREKSHVGSTPILHPNIAPWSKGLGYQPLKLMMQGSIPSGAIKYGPLV